MDHELLRQWHEAASRAEAAKLIIAEERELRKKVFGVLFAAPCEGANTLELGNGWELKGVYKLSRTVDEAALGDVFRQLHEAGVNADLLIKWRPELVQRHYRQLTEEQRQIMDQALIIKPDSPVLELKEPK